MSRGLLALHVLLAAGTGALFLFRARRIFAGRALPRLWRRIVPDINDTLLFASGAALVVMRGHALSEPWLATKLACVVGYVLAGLWALRRKSRPAFALALALYGYILLLALTKRLWPL